MKRFFKYILALSVLLAATALFSSIPSRATDRAHSFITTRTAGNSRSQATNRTHNCVAPSTADNPSSQAIGRKHRTAITQAPNDSLVIHLYPDGQHADHGIIENGIPVTLGPGEANQTTRPEFYWERDGSLNEVSDSARIVIFFPEKPNGQMILICPGGGYNELMFRSEGTYAAHSLTPHGYTIGIICYRMPTGHGEIPLTDVQNAFRYCRHHAGEWQISQIGIMGMSAGGHLAALASTRYTDAITRPDFTILFYPVVSSDPDLIHRGSFRKLTGLSREEIDAALEEKLALLHRYSPDRYISSDTPPALLFHSADDRGVPVANSIRYFTLLQAAGVPAELQIFPSGGHGWGFNTLQTAGRDKLEPHRQAFFATLFSFLDSLRPAAKE